MWTTSPHKNLRVDTLRGAFIPNCARLLGLEVSGKMKCVYTKMNWFALAQPDKLHGQWKVVSCHDTISHVILLQQGRVLSLTQAWVFFSYRKPATRLTEPIKSCFLETWRSCSLLEHPGGIIGKLHYGIKWVEPAILNLLSSFFSLLLSL